MTYRLPLSKILLYSQPLSNLPNKKLLISTLNAHSYNMAQKDVAFAEALAKSDVLLPDGVAVVWAVRLLKKERLKKIAGADLFFYEMERLQQTGGTCFFLGSTEATLTKIKERAAREYPMVKVQTYSPPYKPEFSVEDNVAMFEIINAFQPDVLFIGMTAPKQEKWAYQHFQQLDASHVCCIGAVFNFYAGNINRAPKRMISFGLEWLYRLIKEPKRMWKRYLIGNSKFIWFILNEKWRLKFSSR